MGSGRLSIAGSSSSGENSSRSRGFVSLLRKEIPSPVPSLSRHHKPAGRQRERRQQHQQQPYHHSIPPWNEPQPIHKEACGKPLADQLTSSSSGSKVAAYAGLAPTPWQS